MRSSWRTLAVAALVAVAGCARPAPPADGLVRLDISRALGGALLTLVPAPGARINAKLRPVLELEDGTRLDFNQDALTADSGYFALPPTAAWAGNRTRLKGVLRTGVCPAGQNVCLPLTVPVDQALPPG